MATRTVLVDIDLKQNELQNAVVQNLASAPSNPKAGQEYFNTTDNKKYIYNGSAWVSEVEQGSTYTFSTGLTENAGTVTLNEATSGALGGVIVGSNINVSSGTISIADASTSTKGVIEIATDTEASTGTSETLAINPKQLATKIGLGDLSIDSGSSNYLSYNSSTGAFSANVDTTVTESSTNLVTSGAVSSAIASAIVGALTYQGTWTATSQTDYSSITLPVKKGYMYLVEGSATVGGIEWNAGDYLIINKDIASGGTITSSDVEKIDNTEGTDIVRLNATQTLTNKTIDADDNTISDLTTSNLKSGVLQTTVRAVSSASDTAIPSEKAVASALASKKIASNNPALTASSGVVTWTISNTLATADVQVQIFEVSTGTQVMAEVSVGSSTITIKMNSSSNISADTYRAVIIG